MVIKFITEEIEMNVPMDIVKLETPVLGDIINSCVSIIKSNNGTKVALKQIDAVLNMKLKDMKIIENFSLALDETLSRTDISNEMRLLFIDKFIKALLDAANNNYK